MWILFSFMAWNLLNLKEESWSNLSFHMSNFKATALPYIFWYPKILKISLFFSPLNLDPQFLNFFIKNSILLSINQNSEETNSSKSKYAWKMAITRFSRSFSKFPNWLETFKTEMEKAADAANMSVLFFSAGAHF